MWLYLDPYALYRGWQIWMGAYVDAVEEALRPWTEYRWNEPAESDDDPLTEDAPEAETEPLETLTASPSGADALAYGLAGALAQTGEQADASAPTLEAAPVSLVDDLPVGDAE